MTPLLAILEFTDYAFIAFIVSLIVWTFNSRAVVAARDQLDFAYWNALNQKVDALLKHHGVELPPQPSGLSTEVERLALDEASGGKIAAIKLYREQNPGAGLAQAKLKIEVFRAGKLGRP